jgi:hypothetical protein
VLRRTLREMTEVLDISQHPSILRKLTRTCPNTISVLKSEHPLERYTCAMYAFDFAEKREYVQIAECGRFAGRDFLHWLLNMGLLEEVSEKDACQGDLVIYFSEAGRFEHIGAKPETDRVVSKWGTGHLYEHGLFEVPESYGTTVRFFKRLTFEAAYGYFREFAAAA